MYGVTKVKTRGQEYIKASLSEGKGVMLTPNHCHPADAMVMALALKSCDTFPYTVASWHLFKQNWLQSFILPRAGVFSIYREGMDREALKCCVDILAKSNRPLLLFPEGVISRTNDRVGNFMEGLALISRMAAKQRGDGNVVIHPTAIRYHFEGDLESAVEPTLDNLEERLTWRIDRNSPYHKRIANIAFALLCLKEIEYYGDTGVGDVKTRLDTLIDTILCKHEREWLNGTRSSSSGDTTARVKTLRTALLPDIINNELTEEERGKRWNVFKDVYLAQQLANYDINYFNTNASNDQILESVQKLEEDLTDKVKVVGPITATVTFCPAIPVSSDRSHDKSGAILTAKVKEEVEKSLK
jgi:hypothetical protein